MPRAQRSPKTVTGAPPSSATGCPEPAALEAWPGAQSARVALMTLLVNRGSREEAGSLAEAAQTAADDQYDPWWTYWLGDFRAYPALLDRLRAMAQ